MQIRKKAYTERNVKEAAVSRIEYLFRNFDKVSVSFSGGKDSTACLNLTLEVAERQGKLPVRAIFFDEEAIHPTTIEYVERVRHRPGVALEWYCLPVTHRNACSNDQPFWECWNPEEKHLWVRDLPECAITTHPAFKRPMSIPEVGPQMLARNEVCIQGMRAQESVRRYRMIASKLNDSFIARKGGKAFGYPIYDWSSTDVWQLIHETGYDYNQTYDILNRTRMHEDFLRQRICPPYGEEPLRGLWVYAECWPELWHKMLYRVKGAATAWRYSNTELYSSRSKPPELTWEQYTELQIANYTEAEIQASVRGRIESAKQEHFNKTDEPIPEEQPHILSGCSWKFLAKMAIKGDFKGRQRQLLASTGAALRTARGLTLAEVIKKHGSKKFQEQSAAH